MFWKIKSKEYLELADNLSKLKARIADLELVTESHDKRFRKKLIKKIDEAKEEEKSIDDGFNELRNINKP